LLSCNLQSFLDFVSTVAPKHFWEIKRSEMWLRGAIKLLREGVRSLGTDQFCLTNNQHATLHELVWGNLEVEGGRTLANATRSIVVRAVAWAVVATIVT
jgi:hypothetical protein